MLLLRQRHDVHGDELAGSCRIVLGEQRLLGSSLLLLLLFQLHPQLGLQLFLLLLLALRLLLGLFLGLLHLLKLQLRGRSCLLPLLLQFLGLGLGVLFALLGFLRRLHTRGLLRRLLGLRCGSSRLWLVLELVPLLGLCLRELDGFLVRLGGPELNLLRLFLHYRGSLACLLLSSRLQLGGRWRRLGLGLLPRLELRRRGRWLSLGRGSVAPLRGCAVHEGLNHVPAPGQLPLVLLLARSLLVRQLSLPVVLRQPPPLLLGHLIPPPLLLTEPVLLFAPALLLAPALLGGAGGGRPRQGLAALLLRLLSSSLHLDLLPLSGQRRLLSCSALSQLPLLLPPASFLLLDALSTFFFLSLAPEFCFCGHLAALVLSLFALLRLPAGFLGLASVIHSARPTDQSVPDAAGAGVASVRVGGGGGRGGGGAGVVGVLDPPLQLGLLRPHLGDASLDGSNLGLGRSTGGDGRACSTSC
mmetsp:Transcript_77729/g.207650  ORF Transcript_77729/g.207650 Transcript_77729/m.207650 type:complete len:471 (-) Transcript_77729:249-1661(-)